MCAYAHLELHFLNRHRAHGIAHQRLPVCVRCNWLASDCLQLGNYNITYLLNHSHQQPLCKGGV
jgi:hypothetical protein